MKYLLALPCLLLILSCKKEANSAQTDADSSKVTSLKKQFLPVIQGNWVAADYITKLQSTKSPYKAYEELHGLAALVIDGAAVTGDSLIAHVNYNNHEDGTIPLYFKSGKTKNSLTTGYKYFDDSSHTYELTYSINKTDTLLVINHYDETGKLSSFKKYSRVGNTVTPKNTGWGIENIVNKTLIAGNYIIEGTKPAVKVSFTADGKVTGFEGLESYVVGTDFATNDPDELPPTDYIYFKKGGVSESTSYTFKILGNTLLLSGSNEHYLLVKQ